MNGKDTVMFSSESDEWQTPIELFKLLDKEFIFDCDAAATESNSLCGDEYLQNALSDEWLILGYKRFFLNPPYSKISAFIKKAYEESQKGATVVCLIPCRCDTKYWHSYVMKALEIRFIKSRVNFYGKIKVPRQEKDTPKDQIKYTMGFAPAPFPSCIVIFKPGVYTPTISSFFQ